MKKTKSRLGAISFLKSAILRKCSMLRSQNRRIKINQGINAVSIIRQSYHLYFLFIINKTDIMLNSIVDLLQHPVFDTGFGKGAQ